MEPNIINKSDKLISLSWSGFRRTLEPGEKKFFPVFVAKAILDRHKGKAFPYAKEKEAELKNTKKNGVKDGNAK